MKQFMVFLLFIFSISVLTAQKKPLDHSVYEKWNFITYRTISDDGEWVGYTLGQENRDGKSIIYHVPTGKMIEIIRGDSARFDTNGRFAIVKVKMPRDSIRKAKLKEKKKKNLPKDSLYIINLQTGDIMKFGHILSVQTPAEKITAVAFLYDLPKETKADSADTKEKKKKRKNTGHPLKLFIFSNQKQMDFQDVTTMKFNEMGTVLLFAHRGADSLQDGVTSVSLPEGNSNNLFTGPGEYPQLGIDREGIRVAFIREMKKHARELYAGTIDKVRKILDDQNNRIIPEGWEINPNGRLEFSENGKRLFFGFGKIWPEAKNDSIPDDEKVKVDIWHWKDPYLQPMQLKQVKKEKARSYKVLYDLSRKRFVQLEDESVPTGIVGDKGNGNFAVGISNIPYRMMISWDYPPYYDIYKISVKDGRKTKLLEKIHSYPQVSPDGRYVAWWDRNAQQWKFLDVKNGKQKSLSGGISENLTYFLHDWPYKPDSYGFAGWTKDKKYALIYGKYDIWAVSLKNPSHAFRLTRKFGEEKGVRLRLIDLDPDEKWVDLKQPQLMYGFHYENKQSGYFKLEWNGKSGTVHELIYMPKRFGRPVKAKNSDHFLFTREDFQEFPDLWVSDWNFAQAQKISRANPQQKEYLWGSVELIHWYSLDGKKLDGLLYKPEGFDPQKKYPMMVYFYEKNSDNLYRHWAPQPHRSIINFTFYVSRGYLVFVPDIHYKVGYPGESAVNCVLPGVTSLIEKGYVDEKHIGVQGHSWGGYQIAYLVTQTDIFAAAEAGAPVSNMFSAYGGIRWGSGMSRMFQYEKTQSRIGRTIWNGFLRYLENSPLFWVEKIHTPLLIMHNDRDGAVPWYQGIELFVAMRRLGKPAWLINYNKMPHWPITYATKKDWAIRMQQFFDHFLKGAPAPVWLKEGVPAVLKGTTLGYELEK